MKVLYNACYGGFGISLFAVLKLIKKKKLCISAYRPCQDNIAENDNSLKEPYKRIKARDVLDIDYWGDIKFVRYATDDIVDKSYFNDNPDVLSYTDVHDLFINPDSLRFDKKLIKLVEKYGSDKISASGARLEIKTVPAEHNFCIEENDGYEDITIMYYDAPYYYAYE